MIEHGSSRMMRKQWRSQKIFATIMAAEVSGTNAQLVTYTGGMMQMADQGLYAAVRLRMACFAGVFFMLGMCVMACFYNCGYNNNY
jgi:hypothetical protein